MNRGLRAVIVVATLSLILPAWSAAAAPADALGDAWADARAVLAEAAQGPILRVDACFSRGENADADRVRLPKRFCIDSVSLLSGVRRRLQIAGSPVSGRVNVVGGAWNVAAGRWEALAARLFDSHDRSLPCGRLNAADATIFVDVDEQGSLLPRRPRVTALLYEVAVQCPAKSEPLEIRYEESL